MDSKVWLGLGAISGFFGVALGAFGAHALRETLSEKAMSVYQTAVQYQFIHALALVGLGIWCAQFHQPVFAGRLCCRYRDWETDRKSTRLNSSHRL